MKPKDFEQAVLDLAMTTRVPLTKANILFYTGVASKQADKWLDHMLAEGLADIDNDDDGEVIYVVKGAARPKDGPRELRRCAACGRATVVGSRCSRCGQLLDSRLRALKGEVDRASTALSLLSRGNDLLAPTREGQKSVLAAGLLGLFGGPLGWLYAAPLREAGPAVGAFLLILWLIPNFVLVPTMLMLLPILMPTSALVGALYAWKHNRSGRRTGLLTDDSDARSGP